MEDVSLVIVKPEVIGKIESVKKSLGNKGYLILFEKSYSDWLSYARKIYSEFTAEEIQTYIDGYSKHSFGKEFIVLLVKSKKGNTLKRLNEDKGNFIRYQKQNDDSLRSEFGLSADYNLKHGNVTFVYCGIHCPESQKELDYQLNLFKLS